MQRWILAQKIENHSEVMPPTFIVIHQDDLRRGACLVCHYQRPPKFSARRSERPVRNM
jgi:hypothetical protein